MKLHPYLDSTQDLLRCFLVKIERKEFWSTSRYKKYLIEAWIWSAIVRIIFWSPFKIFFKRFNEITVDMYRSLFGQDHQYRLPVPSELAVRWRHITAEGVLNQINADVISK